MIGASRRSEHTDAEGCGPNEQSKRVSEKTTVFDERHTLSGGSYRRVFIDNKKSRVFPLHAVLLLA